MRLDAIFDASASLQYSLNQPRLFHVLYHGNQSLELCGALPASFDRTATCQSEGGLHEELRVDLILCFWLCLSTHAR